MKIICCFAFLPGVCLLAVSLFLWVRDLRYRRRFSGTARALVTSPAPDTVLYTYTVNKTEYRLDIGTNFMDRCGTNVDIRYDPADPGRSQPDRKWWESCVIDLMSLLLILFIVMFPLLGVVSSLGEVRATVNTCETVQVKDSKGRKRTEYKVSYAYQVDGSEYLGSEAGSRAYKSGESIDVFINRANPKDSVTGSFFKRILFYYCFFTALGFFSLLEREFKIQPAKARPVRNSP